jgi:hypothetical protein
MKRRVDFFPVLFLMCMIFTIVACEDTTSTYTATPKQEIVMPPYTDTGADVLAFRVYGRIVIAEDRVQRTRSITMFYFTPVDSLFPILFIESGYNSKTRFEGIRLSLSNVVDTGYYYLKEATEINRNQGQYLIGESMSLAKAFTTRDYSTGYVHIKKLDTINHIIAGTFAFRAEQFLFGDDVVTVTGGQFDATY